MGRRAEPLDLDEELHVTRGQMERKLFLIKDITSTIWGAFKRAKKKPDLDGLLGDYAPSCFLDDQLERAYYDDPGVLYEPYSRLMEEWKYAKSARLTDEARLKKFRRIISEAEIVENDMMMLNHLFEPFEGVIPRNFPKKHRKRCKFDR